MQRPTSSCRQLQQAPWHYQTYVFGGCVWLCVRGWQWLWLAIGRVYTSVHTQSTHVAATACLLAFLVTTDHGRHNEHCWQDCVCAQRLQLCSHRHICMCSCFRLHLCVQWLCLAEAARSSLLRLYITLQQSARYEGRTHTHVHFTFIHVFKPQQTNYTRLVECVHHSLTKKVVRRSRHQHCVGRNNRHLWMSLIILHMVQRLAYVVFTHKTRVQFSVWRPYFFLFSSFIFLFCAFFD